VGKGRARGCEKGDILSESFLDIDSIHFNVSSRFLPLYSLIFNLSPASFIAFFVSPSSLLPRAGSESPPANGLARIQQIKRKFVSPQGRARLEWEVRGGRLINGLLAEGGCIIGEKKISPEKAGGT
jgi:hypothetical protein